MTIVVDNSCSYCMNVNLMYFNCFNFDFFFHLLWALHVQMYYDVETPLKSLASLSTPDSQTLAIQPFDKSVIADVERALNESDIGLTPNNDGNIIRLNVPQLTKERRKVRNTYINVYREEKKLIRD